jgi:hypothetical protein
VPEILRASAAAGFIERLPGGQRKVGATRGLPRHDRRLPHRTVQHLRVSPAHIRLHHAAQRVVGQARAVRSTGSRVDGQQFRKRIPSIGVERIIEQVSVPIVADRGREHAIVLIVVGVVTASASPAYASGLCYIPKLVVAEGLRPWSTAIRAEQATKIVVSHGGRGAEVTSLRPAGIEAVGDRKRAQRTISIPRQRPGNRFWRRTDRERVGIHPLGAGIIGISVVVGGAANLDDERASCWVERGAGGGTSRIADNLRRSLLRGRDPAFSVNPVTQAGVPRNATQGF